MIFNKEHHQIIVPPRAKTYNYYNRTSRRDTLENQYRDQGYEQGRHHPNLVQQGYRQRGYLERGPNAYQQNRVVVATGQEEDLVAVTIDSKGKLTF